MRHPTAEKVEINIEEQVALYRELTEQRRIFQSRVEKAQAHERSVNKRVYTRVYEDYVRRLQQIERELEPLAAAVQKARSTMQDEIRDIDVRIEKIQDDIDEIAFRYRLGEFETETSNEKQIPLAEEYERLVQRRRELSASLARIEDGEAATPASSEPPDRETSQELPDEKTTAGAPAQAPRSPADTEDDATLSEQSATGGDAFVDPTEWVGEFIDAEPKDAKTARSDASSAARLQGDESMDTLTALADPSDDSAASSPADDRSREKAAPGLPILTVVTGPASGKRLPLLPITMTVGREVDNNIELKDVDVARYHARISFEGGQYTIQDLEGSSGTFVDGKRISKAVLTPGSSIRVGNSELRMDLG